MSRRANAEPASAIAESRTGRVEGIDWTRARDELSLLGYAVIDKLPQQDECRILSCLYPEDRHFRSRVVMASHGFGKGEHKYFAHLLPELIEALRAAHGALPPPRSDRQRVERGVGDCLALPGRA